MASTPSPPPLYQHTEQSRDDMVPIDLTADDDDDPVELPPAKRQRLGPNIPPLHLGGLGGLNSQLRMLAKAPPSSLPMPILRANGWPSTSPCQNRAWSSQPNPRQHMPVSNGNPMHYQSSQTRSSLPPHAQYASQPPRLTALPQVTAQNLAQNPYLAHQVNNVMWPKQPETIDLTRESTPLLTLSSIEHLEANAPVLIGQLNVTALVLYPNPYLSSQRGGIDEWAPIRIAIDPNAKPPTDALTLHIPPKVKGANPTAQDSFGVIGRQAGPTLAPLLSRGVVKLEPRIKRSTSPDLNCMPLAILVFTPKGNVPHVSATLKQAELMLDHPTSVFDLTPILHRVKYYNPHNPPPGGFRATTNGRSNPLPLNSFSKCSTPQVTSKGVEIQRSQVEDVFQKLRSEDDLKETSPGSNICTNLYPHQKKAVTFLLEREQEIVCPAGKAASLWNPHGHAWQNVITQEIVFMKPRECKGALLADDMGLGKSLEALSLLAVTMFAAQDFGARPLEPPERPIDPDTAPNLTATQFAGAAWDMPDTSKVSATKAKLRALYEKKMVEYNRLSLLKERSRATLIVCPLSTLVSWEDQFKEHWGGEVQVVGGVNLSGFATAMSSQAPTPLPTGFSAGTGIEALGTMSLSAPNRPPKPGAQIRVYMYHGASRRPDPVYIADFDVVITTYSTLATEYSKQMRSGQATGQLDPDEDGGSSDGGVFEVDQDGNPVAKKKKPVRKRKMCGGETASPLQAIHWFRVILDEAHCIKETSTVASRACCDLISDRRLCLTGTPVQNKLDDLYALIKFLRVGPFDDKATWTAVIGNLVKFNDHLGVTRLQTLMKLLTLRRTKDTRGKDGKPILALPPRNDRMHVLKLTPEEREVYDTFFNESQAEFRNMAQNEIMRNYVNILQKILRLRQICDDLTLIKGQRAEEDSAAKYEQAIADIAKEGINLERATAVFALLKDTSTAQCVECGMELAPNVDGANGVDLCGDVDEVSCKKPRAKAAMKASRANSPSPPTLHPIITRCQHLFCLTCFRSLGVSEWPKVPQDTQIMCTACNCCIQASDAIEVRANGPEMMAGCSVKKTGMVVPSNTKKERRQRGAPIVNYRPSTKTQALITDLLPFSKQNPFSSNYDPTVAAEIEAVDEHGDTIDDGITKSVVFSQWTSMLDRIEEALEVNGIHFERLDGTMKREDRNKSMDALKNDPKCEVLLVSLKAGGVGLTLTAARRVYLMDPYWNPAVENQAVDRIHRLGQTHPVIAIKYIIENSIEQRLLEVQKKKADLANMTLGKPLSKHELQQRRLEELNKLLG